MGDGLEEFVKQNRREFDSEIPVEGVWTAIHYRNKQRGKWGGIWKVAAALFLLSTTYLIVEKKLSKSEASLVSLSAEFQEVEAYYNLQIAKRKKEVKQHGVSHLSGDFLVEIERLDQMYASLKQTYNSQNSSELITEMMIKNLQLRIEILNRQVSILNDLKVKTDEESKHVEI